MSDNAAGATGPPSFAEIRETMHVVGEQVRGIAADLEELKEKTKERTSETDRPGNG